MITLLLLTLFRLHFTAPADANNSDTAMRSQAAPGAVRSYAFYTLDSRGALAPIPGWADSTGRLPLLPHAPGTHETVWLDPGPKGGLTTVYVVSVGSNGGRSGLSNGCVIGHNGPAPARMAARTAGATLAVPVLQQSRERCGPAALAMVLRYYGAAPSALREAESAYDPILHGSLITDLAEAARRAGYQAAVATLTPDSLIDLLRSGVPPIVLYANGIGPVTVRHFGVVTGWDADRASFTLLDGSGAPRVARRGDLAKRWQTAGSQALIVRKAQP